MRIDDRRHRVRGVVEAVHELEAECDDQRNPEEEIGKDPMDSRAARCGYIVVDAVGGEQQPDSHDADVDETGAWMERVIELDSARWGGRGVGDGSQTGHCNLPP